MKPKGSGAPTGRAGRRHQGGLRRRRQAFEKLFTATAGAVQGSGWAILGYDSLSQAPAGHPGREAPEPDAPEHHADPGDRRVGARLLPEIPEQARRLRQGVHDGRQLRRRGRAATRKRLPPPEAGASSRDHDVQPLRPGGRDPRSRPATSRSSSATTRSRVTRGISSCRKSRWRGRSGSRRRGCSASARAASVRPSRCTWRRRAWGGWGWWISTWSIFPISSARSCTAPRMSGARRSTRRATRIRGDQSQRAGRSARCAFHERERPADRRELRHRHRRHG